MNHANAIILASGQSKRMGFPKLHLGYDTGHFLIKDIVRSYSEFGCSQIIVVVNNETEVDKVRKVIPKHVEFAVNNRIDLGRMYSLQVGIRTLTDLLYPTFFQNIDNPYNELRLLYTLYNKGKHHNGYVVPVSKNKGGHPIMLSSLCQEEILENQDYQVPLNSFLKSFERINVPFNNDSVLMNLNTKEEYANYLDRT